jgi:hypothetical protein
MSPLQLWIEGYKARGEACKQGGLVGVVLIAVVAALLKDGKSSLLIATAIVLASGVAFSALAYWFLGWAVTDAANKHKAEDSLKLSQLQEEKSSKMLMANFFGFVEIVFLAIGLFLLTLSFA